MPSKHLNWKLDEDCWTYAAFTEYEPWFTIHMVDYDKTRDCHLYNCICHTETRSFDPMNEHAELVCVRSTLEECENAAACYLKTLVGDEG